MRAGQVHGDEVGALADLERAHLLAQAEGARTPDGGHFQHGLGVQEASRVHSALQQHPQSHLGQHVGGFRGGRGIGAQAHAQIGADELVQGGHAHAQLGAGAGAHADGHVVLAQFPQILVVDAHRAHDHHVGGVKSAPVQGVAHGADAGGQPRRDLHIAALHIAAVHLEGRRAVLHEVALLAAAGQPHGHGQVLLSGELRYGRERGRVVGEQRRRGDADGHAVAVHFLAPVQDVLLGQLHGGIDAVLVHGGHGAVDDRAQAQLVHGGTGGAGGGDISHRGDAAGKCVQAAQDGGVEPVGSLQATRLAAHFRQPFHVGGIVHHAAQHRLLQARVQIHQAGHDGREPLIDHFLVGIAQAQHVGAADIADNAIAHEHGAIDDRLGRDRQNVLGAQKHGTSRGTRGDNKFDGP